LRPAGFRAVAFLAGLRAGLAAPRFAGFFAALARFAPALRTEARRLAAAGGVCVTTSMLCPSGSRTNAA
jgi:hypothetical protein